MKLNIINDTSFEKLSLCLNDREYQLSGGKTEIFLNENCDKLLFKIGDKNRVVFSWLFMLIDEFISEDQIWLKLNCNASFEASLAAEKEYTLCLKDLKSYVLSKHSATGECYYNSVYLKSDDLPINNSAYSLTDCEKQKKRSLFLLHFATSWLPVLVGLIVLAILVEEGAWMLLLFAAIVALVFTVPSFKKAKRFKTYFTDESAAASLAAEEKLWRENNGEPIIHKPKGIISKKLNNLFEKIFDRVFKNKIR